MKTLALIIGALFSMMARAEPPWNVDDPGTTPVNTLIFYGAYYGERAVRHSVEENFPFLSFTWGLLENAELGLAIPIKHSDSAGEGEHLGVGDAALAFKDRFWENSLGDALAVSTQLSLPTGDKTKNLGAGESILSLGPIFQIERSIWKLVGQVSISDNLSEHLPLVWFYGLALNCKISERFFIGSQIFSTSPHLYAGVGGGFQLSKNLALQLQLSKGLSNNDEALGQIIYAGATYSVAL